MALVGFLREHKIEEDIIQKFVDEKIDESIILLMTDEQLSTLGLKYGQRILLVNFCKQNSSLPSDVSEESHVQSLLRRITSRVSRRDEKCDKLKGNTNAKKNDRKIEIGWLNYDCKQREYIQVKTRKGGGTRKCKINIKDTASDILERGIKLFFPSGVSSHGRVIDFDFNIANFDQKLIDSPQITVEELYDITQTNVLRLYVCSRIKVTSHESSVKIDLEQPTKRQKSSSSKVTRIETKGGVSSLHGECENHPVIDLATPSISHEGQKSNRHELPDLSHDGQQTSEDELPDLLGYNECINLDTAAPLLFEGTDCQEVCLQDELYGELGEVSHLRIIDLRLHRGQVLIEMENALGQYNLTKTGFADLVVNVKMISPTGREETAEDSGGVFRDALSEYWSTFYSQRTTGTSIKIPCVDVNIEPERWQAAGCVLSLGYYFCKYLPIEISPAFLEYALTGTEPAKETLLPEFLSYIPPSQAKIVQQALSDFRTVDMEELIELYDEYGVHILPTETNLKGVLSDVAHTLFIQTPNYIATAWREPLQIIKHQLGLTFGNMKLKSPTFETVWEILKFPENLSPEQRQQVTFFKRTLREMETSVLQNFLRFCTGANILVGMKIKASFFTPMSDFARRPVGHTCGCVLELPDNYSLQVEMRNEWTNLLSSTAWEMDFV